MSTTLDPYLFFDGTCSEAMRFYEKALGGKIEMMMTQADAPPSAGVPPGSPERIMHASLALGERRSNAVRDYLTQNGVPATRLQSVSYGEEKPKHDNSREETRRLNRRAALVVRLDK